MKEAVVVGQLLRTGIICSISPPQRHYARHRIPSYKYADALVANHVLNAKMFQLIFLLLTCLPWAYAGNFTECFLDFQNNASQTLDATGLVSNTGMHVANVSSDIMNATGFTYSACLNACGRKTGTPDWLNFSQQFSAWLLPYLSLISQLPFGSRQRVSNFMSAVLTVGSPVLAGYSMILTVLNARWINHRFRSVSYPNARHAVHILMSLQQSPLRITNEDSLLNSLVVLPENDDWWPRTAEFLNYTNTWSIASATSVAWVIIAYLLTVFGSLSNVVANFNSNGQGTGSVLLWLIPIVVGWLQLSPKCDHARVQRAMENADAMAFVSTNSGIVNASALSESRAVSIHTEELSSPDEDLTPPIYNYARAIAWSRSAEDVFDVFKMASNKARAHIPVRNGAIWVVSKRRDFIEPCNRFGNPHEIDIYCKLPQYVVRSSWASEIFSRMFIASVLPLALQWATTGAAILVVWYTPTVGLGCRSLGYILYGAMSTVVWMMLVLSSILSHYASSHPPAQPGTYFSSVHLAKMLANILRWGGKSLAIVSAICVNATAMLQFTSVYDNCYCDSSAIGLKNLAYIVVFPSDSQVQVTKAAWIGALVLACTATAGFFFFMNLFTDLLPT